jgi:hypothetical protein
MLLKIEQIALSPRDPAKAMELLAALGLTEWIHDEVVASGSVRGKLAQNKADLHFNYQADHHFEEVSADPLAPEQEPPPAEAKPLELEVIKYQEGKNWLDKVPSSVCHLGMHCTASELVGWRKKFEELGIKIAQEVFTQSHTNPAIAGSRRYQYVIFDTRAILGVDLKFIVRYSTQ